MNYSEITDMVLTYADSQDPEMINKMPLFFKVVEARLNRVLAVQKQVGTLDLPYVLNVQNYMLPIDYASVSNLEHVYNAATAPVLVPYTYVPYKENIIGTFDNINGFQYSIIGGDVIVSLLPSQDTVDRDVLRLKYFMKLPALTPSMTNNWVSDFNPDCYIFGLMVEVNAFKKDKAATTLWDERFKGAISDIKFQDSEYIWNGPTLITRAV
jgi:hypothetical protein